MDFQRYVRLWRVDKMHIELEEWLINELQALDKLQLVALVLDLIGDGHISLEELADYVDNWHRHY